MRTTQRFSETSVVSEWIVNIGTRCVEDQAMAETDREPAKNTGRCLSLASELTSNDISQAVN